jgi:hypothetical protein
VVLEDKNNPLQLQQVVYHRAHLEQVVVMVVPVVPLLVTIPEEVEVVPVDILVMVETVVEQAPVQMVPVEVVVEVVQPTLDKVMVVVVQEHQPKEQAERVVH